MVWLKIVVGNELGITPPMIFLPRSHSISIVIIVWPYALTVGDGVLVMMMISILVTEFNCDFSKEWPRQLIIILSSHDASV